MLVCYLLGEWLCLVTLLPFISARLAFLRAPGSSVSLPSLLGNVCNMQLCIKHVCIYSQGTSLIDEQVLAGSLVIIRGHKFVIE